MLVTVGDHDVGDPEGALKRAALHDLELHAALLSDQAEGCMQQEAVHAVSSTEAIVVGVIIVLTQQTYVWSSFVVPTAC